MKQIKLLFLMVIFILTSCGTSRITSTWKADNIPAKKYNKIIVLGLIRDEDRTIRINMESHLVCDLNELGYEAVSSYAEFGPKRFQKLEEDAAIRRLKETGVDAVLTIVLLNKTKERYYIPDRISYSPYSVYQNHLWEYYNVIHGRIYSPGYYQNVTNYFWESNFYDMETLQLVYSVQTRSFDPSSTESLAHTYGKLIVSDIVKNNILSKEASENTGAKPF